MTSYFDGYHNKVSDIERQARTDGDEAAYAAGRETPRDAAGG